MKVILGRIMLFGLASAATGSQFKCYKTDSKETDADHDACFVKTVYSKSEPTTTRGGLDVAGCKTHTLNDNACNAACVETKTRKCEAGGWSNCEEETVKTCVCKKALCNVLDSPAAGKKIKCYNVTTAHKTDADHDACFVTTRESKSGSTVTRGPANMATCKVLSGSTKACNPMCLETKSKMCTGGGWSTCEDVTEKTCVCKTDLCNGAPANAALTLVTIIAMALITKVMI